MNLQELLGEELYATIAEKVGDKKIIVDTGNLVDMSVAENQARYLDKDSQDFPKQWSPRHLFNETSNMKKKLEGQLADRDKDLEQLKEQLKESSAATEKIQELKVKYQELDDTTKQEFRAMEDKANAALVEANKMFAVKLALRDAGAVHPDLLVPQIKLDSMIELPDGGWTSINEQIAAMKEGTFKDLFGKIVPNGNPSPHDPKPEPTTTQRTELQSNYDKATEQFGAASPQAIALKNELFSLKD